MTHTDAQIGRLIQCLDDLKLLDNTLIYAIIGDNGASAEGSQRGAFNEMVTLTGYDGLEDDKFLIEHIDEFGGPKAYNHYAVGLGARHEYALPVDQASGLPLGWHP